MSYSLNEIESLSKKAARGAGFSWGMAEEAGKSARWLASFGLAGPERLADLLTRHDGVPRNDLAPLAVSVDLSAQGDEMCPITGGAMLCDCADLLSPKGAATLKAVAYPLLILPFAAWTSAYLKQPLCIFWPDVVVEIGLNGIRVEGAAKALATAKADLVRLELVGEIQGRLLEPSFRCEITDAALSSLNSFAHRTYAPATEESRVRGAGAGLADND